MDDSLSDKRWQQSLAMSGEDAIAFASQHNGTYSYYSHPTVTVPKVPYRRTFSILGTTWVLRTAGCLPDDDALSPGKRLRIGSLHLDERVRGDRKSLAKHLRRKLHR